MKVVVAGSDDDVDMMMVNDGMDIEWMIPAME
jgi:hypothetical protein